MKGPFRRYCVSCVIGLILASCASNSVTTPESQQKEEQQVQNITDSEKDSSFTPNEEEAVKIAMPSKKEKSYFSSIDKNILEAVENGSSESLQQAVAELKKNIDDAPENQKVLITVASSIMKICWPSMMFKGVYPETNENSVYIGAIKSAGQGLYDYNTGNSDFLTLVLPSLVLITLPEEGDFYSESRQSLEKALTLRKDSVLAHYLYALLMQRLKEHELAYEHFEKARQISPKCFEIKYGIAESEFSLGRYKSAFTKAREMFQNGYQTKKVLKLCAEASYAAGDLNAAEEYVGRVLQQEPSNSYYVLFRAKILADKGDFIRASSLLDAYARAGTSQQTKDYLLLRSKVQQEWNKNITAALQTLEEAVKRYPDDIQVILAAASLASETEKTIGGKTAAEYAAKILETDPQNVTAMKIQIQELMQQKNWAEAYRQSSAFLKLDGIPQGASHTHIQICINAGKKGEAWNLASKLYSDSPSDESNIQSYISVLIAMQKTAEASNMIAKLLPTASAKMKSFLYYKRSYLVAGEDAVLADLRASLTANPRNKEALFRLYTIYYNKKEYRKAQYYLKQVVAQSPYDQNLLQMNSQLDAILNAQGSK